MSKRLRSFIVVGLMLSAFGVSQAQARIIAVVPSPTDRTIIAVAPANANQIIMKDGNVCDPIRHMGC